MCEFHDCNCNGLGDIWWTDNCMYVSSIDRRCSFIIYIDQFDVVLNDLTPVISPLKVNC